ncbi:hypothetical protein MKX03_036645, partial [Papaver bracteatum]
KKLFQKDLPKKQRFVPQCFPSTWNKFVKDVESYEGFEHKKGNFGSRFTHPEFKDGSLHLIKKKPAYEQQQIPHPSGSTRHPPLHMERGLSQLTTSQFPLGSTTSSPAIPPPLHITPPGLPSPAPSQP